jgi:hypothetical protein
MGIPAPNKAPCIVCKGLFAWLKMHIAFLVIQWYKNRDNFYLTNKIYKEWMLKQLRRHITLLFPY